MNKIKEALKLNCIFIICLLGVSICYFVYVYKVSYNIPFMDYWRIILRTIQMTDQGDSLLNLMWTDDFGQRNPLLYLCLWLNIKFFHLNCKLSEYFAVFPLAISSILIYRRWLCSVETQKISALNRWCGICFIIGIFNLNQWEILSIQFAFSFMIRICVYIFVFYLMDISLHEKNIRERKKYLIFSATLAVIAICGMSQLYFAAMVLTAWLILILHLVLYRKEEDSFTIKECFIWIVFSIIGICIYFFGINMQASGGSGIGAFIHKIFNGDLIRGILRMFSAIIIPQQYMDSMKSGHIYIIGFVIIIIVCISLFLFFWNRMYRESYMPLCLILYGTISMAVIAYGRINVFDVIYLGASRYTVETTMILIGVFYINAVYMINVRKLKIKAGIIVVSMGLVIGFLYSDYTEFSAAEYRQNYKMKLAGKLLKIDSVEDDEIAGLQADAGFIRQLVPILEQRELSMWSESNITYLYGISKNDSWVENDAALSLKSGNLGRVIINGYNPYAEEMNGGTCKIYLNGELYGTCFLKEKFEYEIIVSSNENIEIKFVTENAVQAPEPDIRQLAFVLEKIEIK